MNKPVVYTAFSKGYDTLKSPPAHWRDEVDFVAFLEEERPVAGWEIRPLHHGFADPCRNAKIHKILPHKYFPNREYSLWVDGSIEITTPLSFAELVQECLGTSDLAVFRHRRRNCAYHEAAECIYRGRDAEDIIDRQMLMYRADGYPPNHGLIEGCVLLRRHTATVQRFNEMWHDIISRYSRRDQLSFNYVAEKVGLNFRHLPGIYTDNPHFTYVPHVGHVPHKPRTGATRAPTKRKRSAPTARSRKHA